MKDIEHSSTRSHRRFSGRQRPGFRPYHSVHGLATGYGSEAQARRAANERADNSLSVAYELTDPKPERTLVQVILSGVGSPLNRRSGRGDAV
jgi:hypothetical protein